MSGHAPEVVHNNGWDDEPDWKVMCECGWECWGKLTEAEARQAHFFHAAIHGEAIDGDSNGTPGDSGAVPDPSLEGPA